MAKRRSVFYVSDRTGITAEVVGHSVVTQFPQFLFSQTTIPFVDSPERARAVVERLDQQADRDGARPVVFSTLIDPSVKDVLRSARALFIDCLDSSLTTLEGELGVKASHTVGSSHSIEDNLAYHERIEAVNFSLAHDDGLGVSDFGRADVILVGVSRSGKTPTSLYMAMQFGVRAANYPLTPEDLSRESLPPQLLLQRSKLYGMTIDPERLQQIRNERRPGSEYADIGNCQREIRSAERLMRQDRIPMINTTKKSIEEIATIILHETKLERHGY
ncbi:MAG: kinase/pyrophosphorylase [Oligoflexia bacterium]|nr:kinase/pyrophosphorylase [Oligoflexia bacterium]